MGGTGIVALTGMFMCSVGVKEKGCSIRELH